MAECESNSLRLLQRSLSVVTSDAFLLVSYQRRRENEVDLFRYVVTDRSPLTL